MATSPSPANPSPTNPPPTGTLYGVSAGPGDPDLITLRALKLIQSTTVVAFPAGQGDRPGVAQRIIEPWLTPRHIQLPLRFPYTQDPETLAAAWRQAAAAVACYLQHEDVVFVSEGDVGFYSTFAYLAEHVHRLHPAVAIVPVPGVCSPLAAAAVLGVPLALGDQRLTVLPALYTVSRGAGSGDGPIEAGVSNLETALDTSDAVVLMKVSSVYSQVWHILQRRQLLVASAVVEWATSDRQRLYRDLSDRPSLELSYFSIMIVQVSPSRYGTERKPSPL
ncbi:MAG: precorrin-2 C(20)-methyltransferase [Elainellaceae cyanobacterium]